MHVFVVGRLDSSTVAAVRAVVHDWSAVGLVGPTIWVDPGTGGAVATRIDEGRAERIDLRSWMPRHPGPVRVVSVQALTDPSGCVTVGEVIDLTHQLRLPSGTVLSNLLIPAEDTTAADGRAVFDSHVNVLVQPVDSTDPVAAIEPLRSDSPTFAMHAAAALATAAGAWTGMSAGPLDGEQPWTGSTVVVGRSYLRRLDATGVLDRLADEVFGSAGQLPVTRTQHGEPMGVVAPAAQLAAAEAAGAAVLNKHASITRFAEPPPFQPPPDRRRGLGQTIGLFFSFLGGALRSAPGAWAREIMESARTRVERSATRVFYGDESGYQVVLSGVAQTGTAPTDQVALLESAAVGILSHAAPGSEPPVTRAPQLWDDTVRTVAALADGGEPDPAIRLPGDPTRLVVDDPRRLCAAPNTPPFRIPQGMPAADSGPIHANDPYHARQVDRILDDEARAADVTSGRPGQVERVAAIAQLRHQLVGWVGQQRCATWAISDGLAVELDRARTVQAEMLTAARTAEDTDMQAPLAAQRRVRNGVLGWLAALVVGVLVLVGLRVYDVLPTRTTVYIGVVLLFVTVIGAMVTFVRGQRALWKAIHRIDVAAHRREWLAANGVRVAQEVVRLASLYRQSRAWADVLSESIDAPFGAAPQSAQAQSVPSRLTGDLPLAVAVATAEYVPQAHEPVVYQARARMLRKNWLITTIDERRRLALDVIRERTGRDLTDRLTSDADLVPGGPLLSFLEVLRDPVMRDRAREVAIDRLVSGVQEAGVSDRLLPIVRVDAGAIRGTRSWQDLIGALQTPVSELSRDGFTHAGGTDQASRVARSIVATDVPPPGWSTLVTVPAARAGGRHQLDRLLVRWDLTSPATVDTLSAFVGSETSGTTKTAPRVIDVES